MKAFFLSQVCTNLQWEGRTKKRNDYPTDGQHNSILACVFWWCCASLLCASLLMWQQCQFLSQIMCIYILANLMYMLLALLQSLLLSFTTVLTATFHVGRHLHKRQLIKMIFILLQLILAKALHTIPPSMVIHTGKRQTTPEKLESQIPSKSPRMLECSHYHRHCRPARLCSTWPRPSSIQTYQSHAGNAIAWSRRAQVS